MDAPGDEVDHFESESEPQPFSIVLDPPATLAVRAPQLQHCGGVLIRYLGARKPQLQRRDSASSRGSNIKQFSSHLSSIVVAIRATRHTLHLYRGRKLCRVVEFPSPVEDVAGVPWGSSPPVAAACTDILCVVACRAGTAYALPTAEVLEGAGIAGEKTKCSEMATAVAAPAGASGSRGGEEASGASEQKQTQKRGRRVISTSASAGIFDDLAPTFVGESQKSTQAILALSQQHGKSSSKISTIGSGSSSGGGGVVLGGLVMQAQERWALFTHAGARTVAACSDGASTAVAGIIDRAASYGITLESNSGGGRPKASTASGRYLGNLGGVDGAVPTTSCMVWMENESSSAAGSALGDGKGFPLPPPVFRLLFGQAASSDPADAKHGTGVPKTASVVLIGDTMGAVKWSPVPPHPAFPGGVLASIPGEPTPIVATLPHLHAESKALGVLLVGANGTVLSLIATPGGISLPPGRKSRKRPRPGYAGGDAGGDTGGDAGENGRHPQGSGAGGGSETTGRPREPPLSVSRHVLGLPFPVASACSVPGFIVHCHAGALFATAVPAAAGRAADEDTGRRSPTAEPLECFRRRRPRLDRAATGPGLRLRPVRLPLPCDTVGVAVAPVFAEDSERAGATSSESSIPAAAADRAASAVPRTLVISLSARGRLVGFMAPQSAEELEGWALDTDAGGVRVGSSVGVERGVRCQLERLSSLGRQCAALAKESAGRDREIRILRGATVLLPPLAARATHRSGTGGGGGGGDGASASSGSLAYSIAMAPDTRESATGFPESYGGGAAACQSDALDVRLILRLWPREGGHVRGDLQAVEGGDVAGRWFIVARVVMGSSADVTGDDPDNNSSVGEGWAWSTSALVPMSSLCQGWPWVFSVALALPSARPVTATSWLQFRFCADDDDGGVAWSSGNGGSGAPVGEASGVCVELGSARFDVLDWAVKLPSIPRSAAAVRAASWGPGAIFSGSELVAIADVFGDESPAFVPGADGRSSSMHGGESRAAGSASARQTTRAPGSWCSFRLCLASPGRDAGALLSLLVPISASTTPVSDRKGGSSGSGGGGGGDGNGDGDGESGGIFQAEIAFRVAGQVAVVRASEREVTAAVGWPIGEIGGRGRQRRAGGATAASRVVELAVTCSHTAMAPLVRQALLSRAGALLVSPPQKMNGRRPESGAGGGGGGGEGRCRGGRTAGGPTYGEVVVRGDAAARLVREVHPLKQAVADAWDSVRALDAARSRDGPSAESTEEALALMHRVAQIYQSLRRQQESVESML